MRDPGFVRVRSGFFLFDQCQNGQSVWRNLMPGKHMGLYELPARYGMYSDDTNSTLALATSLVEKQGLMALHCAHMYGKSSQFTLLAWSDTSSKFLPFLTLPARFWQTLPRRGYPDSAQAVMKAVLAGQDITKTGTIAFPTGSFANGGRVRKLNGEGAKEGRRR